MDSCLSLCATLPCCKYVSVSVRWRDCSWFRHCDLNVLLHEVAGFQSAAARTAAARLPAPLPIPTNAARMPSLDRGVTKRTAGDKAGVPARHGHDAPRHADRQIRPSFTIVLWGCSRPLWPDITEYVRARLDGEISAYTVQIPVPEIRELLDAIYGSDDSTVGNKRCGGMPCRQLLHEKAIALEHCPMEMRVLDVTPCDKLWADYSAHVTPALATVGAIEKATRALKASTRNAFAPRLPASVLAHSQTPAWALVMHSTANADETRGLRSTLLKFRREEPLLLFSGNSTATTLPSPTSVR